LIVSCPAFHRLITQKTAVPIVCQSIEQMSMLDDNIIKEHAIAQCMKLYECKQGDREQLVERFQKWGLRLFDINKDGDCQFHAVSHQLYGDPHFHQAIRASVVSWLIEHPKKDFVTTDKGEDADSAWEKYISGMCDEDWGDHLTLQAIADLYTVEIVIISSIPGDNYITTLSPVGSVNTRTIFLGHLAEYHFVSCEIPK